MKIQRADILADALNMAEPGTGILAVADNYPKAELNVSREQLEIARKKNLRLYIEYPRSVHGLELGESQTIQWERGVISSGFFEPGLERMRIIAIHGCWHLPVSINNPHIVAAKIAGYNKAVYGLPDVVHPILFELPGHNVFIAATCLSCFVRCRYAPQSAWKIIWQGILHWLEPSLAIPRLEWTPIVTAASGSADSLPKDHERVALEKSFKWFRREVVWSIDRKKGALEGFESGIDCRGRQKIRPWVRGDCCAETAMTLAFDWAVNRDPESKKIAAEILNYVWSSPDFYQDDPGSPVYGLNNWFEKGPVFYGDDNARVILSTLAASRLLNDDRWDDKVLRCLLANLRTTGPLGFRKSRLDMPGSFTGNLNWTYYRDHETVDYSPHFQAYLWAAFLWAYKLTGHEGFLIKTRKAIRMTMEAYPAWKWTNGFTQELARMLLPLAFLVRIEDTGEHRNWLNGIASDLLENMQPCGAIRERFGAMENGRYPSPRSNEEYGSTEASLIQDNGDPACDLLYTANYALLGLHEAYSALGENRFKGAEDRLAEFLCRIQARSDAHNYLDGAWMRSFDYVLWEYWGSSADSGWGAWCVETGWTNAWIASVLAMRHANTSLFDLSITDRLKMKFPSALKDMTEAHTG